MSISTTMHEVKSITVSQPGSLGKIADRMSYYRVLQVVTEDGEVFDLTLFSPDQHALTVREEH